MRTDIKASLIISLVALAMGCVAPGRMADLSDCGRASVGVGLGLLVDVEAGVLTHPSLGWLSETKRVGIDSRDRVGRWDEHEAGIPLLLFLIPSHNAHPLWSYVRDPGGFDEAGFWLPPITEGARSFHSVGGNHYDFNNWTDLSVGATLGVVCARAGINPLEFVDFMLGFTGLDIGSDDPENSTP